MVTIVCWLINYEKHDKTLFRWKLYSVIISHKTFKDLGYDLFTYDGNDTSCR